MYVIMHVNVSLADSFVKFITRFLIFQVSLYTYFDFAYCGWPFLRLGLDCSDYTMTL